MVVPDRRAISQLRRLMTWLEVFKVCFGHRAQVLALRRYVQGLLSDSGRKSMEAMLARVTDPGSYQAFQHFITDAPWSADAVWRRLRAVVPEREGLLIFDGTSFPKQGPHSVGVARQVLRRAGQDRQLPSGRHRRVVDRGPRLSARGRAVLADGLGHRRRPPAGTDSRPGPVSRKMAPSADPAAAGPSEWVHRDGRAGRRGIWRQSRVSRHAASAAAAVHAGDLVASHGLSRHPAPADGTPGDARTAAQTSAVGHRRHGTPARRGPRGGRGPLAPRALAESVPRAAWTVDCVAIRVTPAVDCRHRRLMPEIWLLAERDVGATPRTKYYFVHLPPTASLIQIVRLAHHRWAIEQQYQDLKTELGLDHFEGRTFAGWHHHVVLTAIAYNFLQAERQRVRGRLTFPSVRAIVQEIFTAYLFAQRPHYLTRIEALRSVQLRI